MNQRGSFDSGLRPTYNHQLPGGEPPAPNDNALLPAEDLTTTLFCHVDDQLIQDSPNPKHSQAKLYPSEGESYEQEKGSISPATEDSLFIVRHCSDGMDGPLEPSGQNHRASPSFPPYTFTGHQ